MSGRILVFGAGGYMGRLLVKSLVDRGHMPVLAGRTPTRLRRVAGEHGHRLDIALIDATDRDGVANILEKGDIVVNLASPYGLSGIPVVESAMERKCHYLDAALEPDHLLRIFDDCDRWAKASHIAVLPGIGWYSTPGQVLSRRLLDQDPDKKIRRIDIGNFVTEGQYFFTPGAMKTELAANFQNVPQFVRGKRRLVEQAARLRSFWLNNRRQEAASTGGVEQLVLPRIAPHLQEVNSFINRYGEWTTAIRKGLNLITTLPRILPFGEKLLSQGITAFLPQLGPEPRPSRRATMNSLVVATAYDDHRTLVQREESEISDPVGYTIEMMTFAIEQLLLKQNRDSGVLGITECFDIETTDQAHRLACVRLARAHRSIAPHTGPHILPEEEEISELEKLVQF